MATQASTATTAARQHVVVVDADLNVLKALVAPLRGEFEFHITISASDALALLEHRSIAAIVAGQKLFSTSGVELLSEARKRSPRTVRVLLADAEERRSAEHARAAAGAFQILNRPCTAQQLKEVLQVAAWSTSVTTEETGEVEHVVMETAHDQPPLADSGGAPVTVLTTDADLYDAIRTAVQGRHETHLATRLEDATELAATGRCPVLVTDMALAQPALERIARHLGTHEAALVTVVVGSREQGNALMALLSSGVIHRFLLKPVTPGLARLAIDSASRHHHGLLTQPRRTTAPVPTSRPPLRSVAPQPRVEPPHAHVPPADTASLLSAPAKAEPKPRPRFAPSPVLAAEREGAQFELTTPLSAEAAGIEEAAEEPLAERRKWPMALIGGGIAVIALLAAAGGWLWYRSTLPPPADPRQVAIQTNLAAAQSAFDAGRLMEPPGDNALHFYAQVLKDDPQNATALAALDRIAESFIEQAENFMVEGKPDEAAAALENVRRVQPDHRRLRFLDTQLRKEQQDRLVLQARERTTAGDTRGAQQLLEQAARVVPGQTGEVKSAQQAITARERTQTVERELETVRQRLAQGRLVSPPNDSAKSHLRAAQRAEPNNLAVQQGLRDLTERVIAEAEQSVQRRQLDAARSLLREAQDLDATPEQLTGIRAGLEGAQQDRQKNDLLQLVIRRSEENRLLEPAQDSARFYLGRLIQADPKHPAVAQAVRTLGGRLVANAQLAISQRQYDTATRLLNEARAIGFEGPELAVADNALRAARLPAGPVAARIPQEVTPPRRVRAVVPEYPQRALEDGIEGWVDVSFALTPAGDVTNVKVEGATPRNLFDRAALAAVRKWKFEPRAPDAAFAQRMRTRVEFKLKEE